MKNFFVSYKNPVSVLLVLIIGRGLFVYSRLQTSLFPEITFPKIKIIADTGLQPVDKMMITVTKPMENAIKQVPDIRYIRSTTVKALAKYPLSSTVMLILTLRCGAAHRIKDQPGK